MHSPRDGSLRRVIRGAARVVAALGALWVAWLGIVGGFDVRLLGQTISSHEPLRPLLVAALAWACVMLAGGDAGVVRRIRAAADRIPHVVTDRNCLVAAAALAIVVLAVTVNHGSKLAAGSDSFGYLSEADLWLAGGRLTVPMPWTRDVPWAEPLRSFTPLAYRPGPEPWAVVPAYSPGLPMLMALAKWVGGQGAAFIVVPIAGALLALGTFGLGRRLGSSRLGLVAATLVATSPTAVRLELMSMSDVPVAAAWTLAWCGALGQSVRSAIGAAVALAAMLLIRPNLLPIAAVLAGWLVWRVVRDRADRRWHIVRGVTIGAGLAAGVLATAAVYWLNYGSPTVSGYGDVSSLFGVANILPNLRNYGRWFLDEQTMLWYFGVVALFVPVRRLWPGVPDRSVIVAFAVSSAVLVAEFCYFSVFENDTYLRFFLPVYPLVMIGLAALGLGVARRSRLAALGVAFAVVLFVLPGLRGSRLGLDAWVADARFLELLTRVRAATPDNSAILSMQHSGSVRYHAGRVSLRWDSLPEDWLDRSIDWMAERGVRTYAVLDTWELPLIRERFAGQRALATFDGPPILQADGRVFFDLNSSREPTRATEVIGDVPRSNRTFPAMPLPVIEWKR